jgi:hypothetical protein
MLDTWWELPEKLKSCDDQAEHLRGGGYRRGVSMQRYCTHCMHKVHRSYKYTIQRRDAVVFAVVSDGGVKKEVECSS